MASSLNSADNARRTSNSTGTARMTVTSRAPRPTSSIRGRVQRAEQPRPSRSFHSCRSRPSRWHHRVHQPGH
uniref:Uncharacterized protein n=1 Tax=Macrostomum lignano TaxID=282301 RepID=A0A1I8FP26_9PLAT